MRTGVNFMRMNEIEKIYQRLRVQVKVEPRSSLHLRATFDTSSLFYLHSKKFPSKLLDCRKPTFVCMSDLSSFPKTKYHALIFLGNRTHIRGGKAYSYYHLSRTRRTSGSKQSDHLRILPWCVSTRIRRKNQSYEVCKEDYPITTCLLRDRITYICPGSILVITKGTWGYLVLIWPQRVDDAISVKWTEENLETSL